MSGGDLRVPGARDPGDQGVGLLGGHDAVVGAGQDQGRGDDPPEGVGEVDRDPVTAKRTAATPELMVVRAKGMAISSTSSQAAATGASRVVSADRSAALKAAGRSCWAMCPAPAMTVTSAPGVRAAQSWATATGISASSAPWM